MGRQRLAKWSVAVAFAAASTVAAAQESSQKLFESGNYGAVVERAASGAPEDIYLAAMAHLKAGNAGGANDELRRLQEQGDEAWKHVGASGAAMVAHNDGEAVAAGRRATEAGGDNPYAHYQLGMRGRGRERLRHRRRGVGARHRAQARLRLRPLLRRSGLPETAERREGQRALSVLPPARARLAGPRRDPGHHALAARLDNQLGARAADSLACGCEASACQGRAPAAPIRRRARSRSTSARC